MSEIKDWNPIDELNTEIDGYQLSNPYQHITRKIMGAIKRKFDSESSSAFDFGAKGDGVADDYPALQQAISDAHKTGRVLVIPAGTYRLSHHVTFYSGTTVFGYGATLLRSYANDGAGGEGGTGTLAVCYPTAGETVVKDIAVFGLKFDFNGLAYRANGNVVTIGAGDFDACFKDIKFIDCIFTHWVNLHAIDADSVDGLWVERCRFEGCLYDDTLLDLTDPGISFAHARREAIQYNGGVTQENQDGTQVGDQNFTIRGCYFGNCAEEGYSAPRCGVGQHSASYDGLSWNERINVENCMFDGCGYAGVTVFGLKNSTISGNTFKDCWHGIELSSQIYVDADNSEVAVNAAENISIVNNSIINSIDDSLSSRYGLYCRTYVKPQSSSALAGTESLQGGAKNVMFSGNRVQNYGRAVHAKGVVKMTVCSNAVESCGILFSGAGEEIGIKSNASRNGGKIIVSKDYFDYAKSKENGWDGKNVCIAENLFSGIPTTASLVQSTKPNVLLVCSNILQESDASSSDAHVYFKFNTTDFVVFKNNVVYTDAARNISDVAEISSGSIDDGNHWIVSGVVQ